MTLEKLIEWLKAHSSQANKQLSWKKVDERSK